MADCVQVYVSPFAEWFILSKPNAIGSEASTVWSQYAQGQDLNSITKAHVLVDQCLSSSLASFHRAIGRQPYEWQSNWTAGVATVDGERNGICLERRRLHRVDEVTWMWWPKRCIHKKQLLSQLADSPDCHSIIIATGDVYFNPLVNHINTETGICLNCS